MEPSIRVTSPHEPHKIVELIGSSRVVSTLYMTRPASTISSEEGFQSAIFSDDQPASFESRDIPQMNMIIPQTEIGAPILMARVSLETIIIAPMVRQMIDDNNRLDLIWLMIIHRVQWPMPKQHVSFRILE